MSSIMNRKFTQILFGSVLFEVSSVQLPQLRQLRLRHGTAAEHGASEIWGPRDADVGPGRRKTDVPFLWDSCV